MTPILFDGWTGLFRVVIVGTCAYVALLLILRVSGKRTLAKLSAFDFVVTIALGSTSRRSCCPRTWPWRRASPRWGCWPCWSSWWPGDRAQQPVGHHRQV